ncbi:hypothetical protein BH09PAT2_BH09PAT2_07710 [soil metagenome]
METEILSFLKNNKPQLCVLSTVNETGKPECAVLAYVVLDDLSLIISTHSSTRKWENLANNKHVAATMGWDFVHPNVQYEGEAECMEQGSDYEWHQKTYFAVHPELKQFKSPNTVFIKVKPKWIRMTDLSQHPPKIAEIKL